MTSKRFRRDDWLDFGLLRLAQAGPDALRLSELCASAGRTIGSFYHHFEDKAAFFDALMAHWRKTNSTDVIARIDEITDAELQAERLNAIARSMNQSVEVGVRIFANQNKAAAHVVAEVDQERIAYLAGLYHRRLALDVDSARTLAELEYAAFVGTQTIWNGGTLEHGQKLSSLFQKMISSHFVQDQR
jgi:AcrR family transcriptional regulator